MTSKIYGNLQSGTNNKVIFDVSGATAARTITVPDISDTLVTLTAGQTLTNKTLTAPIISTISNTGTLTLPTSTDTLIGRTTTDTLNNKSSVDTTNFVINNIDGTKKVKFDASAISSLTTRTFTFPDITDTVVTLNAVQTLTNKSLTNVSSAFNNGTAAAPSINFLSSSSTGFSSPATNTLAFSTNGVERISVDTSGHVGINTAANPTPSNSLNEQFVVAGNAMTFVSRILATPTLSQSVVICDNNLFAIVNGGGTFGFQIYEISDPANLILLNTTSYTSTFIQSLTVQGQYLYLTAANTSAYLAIYDISNAVVVGSPVYSAIMPIGGIGPILTSGSYLYNANSAVMAIYDISNPTSPSPKGSVVTSTNPLEIFIYDIYIFVVAIFNLDVFNVSNPSLPTSKSSISYVNGVSINSCAFQYPYIYVVVNSPPVMQIYNVVVGSINYVSQTAISASPRSATVRGRYLYIGYLNGTVGIYDVYNPTAVVALSSIAVTGSILYMTQKGNNLYFTEDTTNAINVYDVGGSYIQQSQIGDLNTSTFSVNSLANIKRLNVTDGASFGNGFLAKNGAVSGTLELNNIDSVGNLTIGPSIVSAIAIGRSAITTTVNGTLSAATITGSTIDSASSLTIGGSTATSLAIGRSAVTTTVNGTLSAATITGSNIDSAGALSLAPTTATSLAIGRSAITTTVNGIMIPTSIRTGLTLTNVGTVTLSGTTVTGSSTLFSSSMVGGLIYFITSQTARVVTAVASTTSLTVDTTGSLASQSYNLFYNGLSFNGSTISATNFVLSGNAGTITGALTASTSISTPTLSATTSATTPLMSATTSVTTPLVDNSTGLSLGTTSATSVSIGKSAITTTLSSGNVQKPNIPNFSVTFSGATANATGDGTTITCTWNAEQYDQSNSFATNTFTVPYAGKYFFAFGISFAVGATTGITSGSAGFVVNGTLTYTNFFNPLAIKDVNNNVFCQLSANMTLAVNDIVVVTARIAGGAKTVAYGLSDARDNFFMGYLIG